MQAVGLLHQATAESQTPGESSAVAIASRSPLEAVRQPLMGANGQRLLEAVVDGVLIAGAYFPNKKPKVEFWRNEFLPYARTRLVESALLVGDWNSGSHFVDEAGKTLHGAVEFEQMAGMGWVDCWRSTHPDDREFTWFSHSGNGFRLDHAFASPSLAPRVSSVWYDHSVREAKVSDHSAMVVGLA